MNPFNIVNTSPEDTTMSNSKIAKFEISKFKTEKRTQPKY